MAGPVRAPFPYNGGKHRVAGRVWREFGNVDSYVEPFCGSAACLLARPSHYANRREVVGDKNGYVI